MKEQFSNKIKHKFTIMPNTVFDIGLTCNEIGVLLRILYRSGFEGECFESRASIAEALDLSEKTVTKCFAELERLNIVQITRRQMENKPNLITVNCPSQWQSKGKNLHEGEQKPEVIIATPSEMNDADLRKSSKQPGEMDTYVTRLPKLYFNEQDSLNSPTAFAVDVLDDSNVNCKTKKKEKQPTGGSLIFEAYSRAYFDRYGFDPTRGKEANRWAKKIYEEVGTDEGCQLVAHYVAMNKQWFLQKGHAIEWCFRDLTEVKRSYITGRTMTNAQIKQIEQRQTAKETSDEVQQSDGKLAAAWARIDTTRTIKI